MEGKTARMRNAAISVFELTKGFTTQPTDNAMVSLIEMAGYVMELTSESTLIAEHRLMKDALEQIAKLPFNSNCKRKATDTLKNITL
jgi:hypothetical protein